MDGYGGGGRERGGGRDTVLEEGERGEMRDISKGMSERGVFVKGRKYEEGGR